MFVEIPEEVLQGKENRGATRKPTMVTASIIVPDMGVAAKCVIRELSRTGAQLRFREDVKLPDIFWLRMEGEPNLRYCAVRWMRDRAAGVDFAAERAIRAAEEEARKVRKKMTLHRWVRPRDAIWAPPPNSE